MLSSLSHSIRLVEAAIDNLNNPLNSLSDFEKEYNLIHKLLFHAINERARYWYSVEVPEGSSRLSGLLLDALALCDTDYLSPVRKYNRKSTSTLWYYDGYGNTHCFSKPVREVTIRKHIREHLASVLRLVRIYCY